MADAKKQDRWLDVKDAMAVRTLTLGPQSATALGADPTSFILRLSFYKLAAKLIGRGKRVVVEGCGEGLGAWVVAKECGYALGVDADEAALQSARDNFPAEIVAFASAAAIGPAGPWHAVVRFEAIEGNAGGRPALPDLAPLSHDGIVVLGTTDSATADRLRAEVEPRFHHSFVFRETLGIVPAADGNVPAASVVVGCRPRR